MSMPEPPELQPVRNDGIRAIQVGLGLWAVAGLILLLRRDELADRGHAVVAGRLWGGAARRRSSSWPSSSAPLAGPCAGARRPVHRRGADRLSMGAVLGRMLLASAAVALVGAMAVPPGWCRRPSA